MTPSTFRKLVIAYGGDLRDWPGARRSQADALARATPELRCLLEEAAGLDRALRRLGSRSALSEQRLRSLIGRAARAIAAAAEPPAKPARRTGRAPAVEDC
jgi:hypothetical protein